MTDQLSDLHHAKKGVAILATCIAQTLNESDPSFEDRFLKKISEAYRELKDNSEVDPQHPMELLAWTRTLLTGWDFTSGQGKPFLED